jgi:hypothetical protein
MIAIELLKGLKPVMLEPQIPGQMNFFFEQMVLMVTFTNVLSL